MLDGSLVKQVAVLLQEIVPSAEGPAGDKKLLANEKQSIVDISLRTCYQIVSCIDTTDADDVLC